MDCSYEIIAYKCQTRVNRWETIIKYYNEEDAIKWLRANMLYDKEHHHRVIREEVMRLDLEEI